MEIKSSSNSTIAKNAIFLYIRMFISMVVSLYTSRVVLNTLGVEDYGIYSIVGGVVVMFTFLNASMSGATSRFIAFEIGADNKEKLHKVFSNAIAVHLIIAAAVVVLLETVGLWILNEKLVIAENRMFAAKVVYQLSVVSTFIGITQVPYNSCIVAHEKMDAYAYVELLNVFLKLGIVYLLSIGNYDKLILYGILIFAVHLIIISIYFIYCRIKFNECHEKPKITKDVFKPMLSYAAWGVFGDACYSVRQQGSNILLNMFFGAVVNAANGIAMTVLGVVSGFAQNIITAFRPQIIKSYASNNIGRMTELMGFAMKYSLLLMGMLVIVFSLEIDLILSVWLETVPQYTPWIARIIIITFCFTICSFVTIAGIQATGNVRYQSFVGGTISVFVLLPCIYLLLRSGCSPYSSYIAYCVFTVLMFLIYLIILKKQIPSISIWRIVKGSLRIMSILLLSFIVALVIHLQLQNDLIRFVIVVSCTGITCLSMTYFFAMSTSEKVMAMKVLKNIKEKFFFQK